MAINSNDIEAIVKQVLSNMKTDYVDIYQFHNLPFCPKPGDGSGLYEEENRHILKNDGFVKIENSMFDHDALIIENKQANEVSLCDSTKNPYVKVKFDAPLFGLWSPTKMNAPFVCIEPWYGRCDRNDFCGELAEKDYIINLNAGKTFETEYEIEFL